MELKELIGIGQANRKKNIPDRRNMIKGHDQRSYNRKEHNSSN